MKRIPLVLILTILIGSSSVAQTRQNIHSGWLFRKANSNDAWYKATVPGTVISDLEAAGVIANPFVGCNHEELKWVEETPWEYFVEVDIPASIAAHKRVDLVFEGLDTYAEVYVNGSQVLSANNMFRTWRVNVAQNLKIGKNSVRVLFLPVEHAINSQKAKTGIELPGGEWAYARKAAFQFGWDFAPRLLNCGIWHSVYLQPITSTHLHRANVTTQSVAEGEASLRAEFEVEADLPKKVTLLVIHETAGDTLARQDFDLKIGNNNLTVDFRVLNPLLWWPNGMGSPNIYPLALVLDDGTNSLQTVRTKMGIRTVELVNEPDNLGTSFFFKVNGIPLYAKGANVVPPHSYKYNEDWNWAELPKHAHRGNMNMLRVWGGGIYPKEAFYSACDSLGILVWNDFMFACSMYPWDEDFSDNVWTEAVEQIYRAKGHPSVALWCGNNEIEEGWQNWGWQKQLPDSLAIDTVWKGYRKVFHQILDSAVRAADPSRPYWPSSPQYGWGRSESMMHGDAHYWGVWWGKESFEQYRAKVPRFMSEYGFQSFPSLITLNAFANGQGSDKAFLKCHQKHPEGYQIIDQYIRREKLQYSTLNQRIYFSQLVQAMGYQTAIEAHRLAMPKNMGTLFWQLNDCWPAISWSSIDFGGTWKAVQYIAARSYAPFIVVPSFRGGKVVASLVNDTAEEIDGDLSVQVFTPRGKKMGLWKSFVTLEPRSTKRLVDELIFDDPSQKIPLVAQARFDDGFGNSILSYAFNDRWGNADLKNPKIEFIPVIINGETFIELSVKRPAFFVELFSESHSILLSDNFFHLFPGKKFRVKILSGNPDGIGVRSLWDMLE